MPALLQAPAGTEPTPAAEDAPMMTFLLTALCCTVFVVVFVFGWAALVLGARYDEHNGH